MQIVINIPEILLKYAKTHTVTDQEVDEICDCIKNGTLLPEGHGRLGDLSELEERISGFISNDEKIIDEKIVSREKFILDGIKDSPTIIEADKEACK